MIIRTEPRYTKNLDNVNLTENQASTGTQLPACFTRRILSYRSSPRLAEPGVSVQINADVCLLTLKKEVEKESRRKQEVINI